MSKGESPPVTRDELERALRRAHFAIENLRDDLLRLAAQVVALTSELDERAKPADPEAPPQPPQQIEDAVDAAVPHLLRQIRYMDETTSMRLELESPQDKYKIEGATPPCAELMPICKARCCRLRFGLTTQDLDEGVVRWDYARPYVIRHRKDGFCVHNEPGTMACTIHAQRPGPCRAFDCRGDARIWLDYENRVPAPMNALLEIRTGGSLRGITREEAANPEAVADRVHRRQITLATEATAIHNAYADEDELGFEG